MVREVKKSACLQQLLFQDLMIKQLESLCLDAISTSNLVKIPSIGTKMEPSLFASFHTELM